MSEIINLRYPLWKKYPNCDGSSEESGIDLCTNCNTPSIIFSCASCGTSSSIDECYCSTIQMEELFRNKKDQLKV